MRDALCELLGQAGRASEEMEEARVAISEPVTNAWCSVAAWSASAPSDLVGAARRGRGSEPDRAPSHRLRTGTPGGRGLVIVEAVVDRCGIEALSVGPARKVVWFEIDR